MIISMIFIYFLFQKGQEYNSEETNADVEIIKEIKSKKTCFPRDSAKLLEQATKLLGLKKVNADSLSNYQLLELVLSFFSKKRYDKIYESKDVIRLKWSVINKFEYMNFNINTARRFMYQRKCIIRDSLDHTLYMSNINLECLSVLLN